MAQVELSVVVPCLNEEANLTELVRRVLKTFRRGSVTGEIVLVDDGSRDGSWERMMELSGAHPAEVVPVRHAENRGIAAGWRTGVDAARGDLVALIDADLQYQPEDLLRLRRELSSGAFDVVQGFRSPIGRERDARYHLSRGFNVLLNRTFGMNLRDNKSGFVMSPRAVMLDLLSYEGGYAYFQSFIMVAAHAKGYSYKEVETLFEPRRAGVSFLDDRAYRVAAESLVDLGKAFYEYRVKRPPQRAVSRPGAPPVPRAVPPAVPEKPSLARTALWKTYMASFNRTHWVITRDVERYYDSLERSQWLSLSDMGELQDDKLRRLVRHAYRTAPYYRERLRERGLTPDDVRGRADLSKLPLLTKDDVREHLYFDILSDRHDKSEMLRITTSGSTGEPFVCYADRAQLEFRWAATLRSQEWTGYRFGDRSVRLWHQNIGLSPAQAFMERLDARLSRRRFIPVFELSADRLDEVVARIAEYEPVLVDGYAEALDFLATFITATGPLSHRPRAVMSSAQTLPDASRRLIERAFGCPVFDKYGAREFSGIAYECPEHEGHHVVAEGYIVEVLKDGQPAKPGEVGEVVITDLNNYALPFLRYRIGDLAVARDASVPCRCGRGLPRLGEIQGRVQSIIQGTEGRYLPGTFFSHYLKEMHHAISRFQVVQTRARHMTLRFVPAGRFTSDALDEILATFRRYLGEDMAIDVEQVSEVEMVRTGKRLASVSHLPVDFQKGGLVSAVDCRYRAGRPTPR